MVAPPRQATWPAVATWSPAKGSTTCAPCTRTAAKRANPSQHGSWRPSPNSTDLTHRPAPTHRGTSSIKRSRPEGGVPKPSQRRARAAPDYRPSGRPPSLLPKRERSLTTSTSKQQVHERLDLICDTHSPRSMSGSKPCDYEHRRLLISDCMFCLSPNHSAGCCPIRHAVHLGDLGNVSSICKICGDASHVENYCSAVPGAEFRCRCCGSPDHRRMQCPWRRAGPEAQCRHCHLAGHGIIDCPLRAPSLAEKGFASQHNRCTFCMQGSHTLAGCVVHATYQEVIDQESSKVEVVDDDDATAETKAPPVQRDYPPRRCRLSSGAGSHWHPIVFDWPTVMADMLLVLDANLNTCGISGLAGTDFSLGSK